MVAGTCSVGETVLVLVACVPANAAVDNAIIPSVKIIKYFFIKLLLMLQKSPAAGTECNTYILKLFLQLYNGTSVIRFGIEYALPAFLAAKHGLLSTLVLIRTVDRLRWSTKARVL